MSHSKKYETITMPLTKGVKMLINHIFPNANIEYKPKDKILIYKFKGKIIGFVHYGIRNGKGAIIGVGVLEGHRHKGHARNMLINAIEDIKASGVDRVLIKVNPLNKAALALYKSMQFMPVRKVGKSLLMRRFYEEN